MGEPRGGGGHPSARDQAVSPPASHRGREAGTEGGVFVHGATAWLECSLTGELPAGDHAIALLQVHGLRAEPEQAPLVFHGSRFRRLAAA